MTDLKKEELLKILNEVFEARRMDLQSLFYDIPTKEFNERHRELRMAKKQIRELIQKPQVTEEWIEEKARELWEKGVLYRKDAENQAVISLGWAKDFIRSLVEGVGVSG